MDEPDLGPAQKNEAPLQEAAGEGVLQASEDMVHFVVVEEEKGEVENPHLWKYLTHAHPGEAAGVELADPNLSQDILLIARDPAGVDSEPELPAGPLIQLVVELVHDVQPGRALGGQSGELDLVARPSAAASLEGCGRHEQHGHHEGHHGPPQPKAPSTPRSTHLRPQGVWWPAGGPRR